MLLKNIAPVLRCTSGWLGAMNATLPRILPRISLNIGDGHSYSFKRWKYTQNIGVKGIRPKKSMYDQKIVAEDEEAEVGVEDNGLEALNLEDRAYDEVASGAMHVTRTVDIPQSVLIIQPYVKWGAKRNKEIQPDDQVNEAEALVRSLPEWDVALSLKVPLETLDKKTLFGTGKMEELKNLVQGLRQNRPGQKPLTCVFVSKGSLTFTQKRILETEFNLPVMDRYSVVIQILRLHASSAEARLQVAMAELPYIWAQAKDANPSMSRRQGFSLTDTQREILKTRERKLKNELDGIRNHRKLLRNKRKLKNYPIVAVVGYTNAGKTSLIKALTDEQKMQPRNQLFATLDVTAHAGVLPCNLEVIYMDTVGFMSDLPTGLLECFIATLEDAMLADVIVHVQDLSHVCCKQQKQHVEHTLQTLIQSIFNSTDEEQIIPPIINVGNKIDLVKDKQNLIEEHTHLVSSKEQTGLHDLLLEIEKEVLATTNRRKLKIRVRNGGNEMAWLYKNAAVVNIAADTKNVEQLLMEVVITDIAMQQFKKQFCQ